MLYFYPPMFNRYLTYFSPALQFVVFCAIMSMALFAGGHLIDLFNTHYLGLARGELEKIQLVSPELAYKLKIMNPILQLAILLLPALLFAYLAWPRPVQYLGLQQRWNVNHLGMAILLFLASIPFVYLLEEWCRMLPGMDSGDTYSVISKAMLKVNSPTGLMLNLISICLVPALAEELFFRGCLQQVLLGWMRTRPFVALFIVAVLFSAYHAQLSGFIPRIFLGLLLGLVYYFSANLWYSILVHFINNAMAVFFSWFYERGITSGDWNHVPHMNTWLGLLSLALTLLIAWWFYKTRIPFPIREMPREETDEIKND